jgi:hypothetical protein
MLIQDMLTTDLMQSGGCATLHGKTKSARHAELHPNPTGKQIREKIATNRKKRLNIADAMKEEAGVTAHTVNTKNLDGLAHFDTGEILSAAGRNMRELHIVAHECGHIFLHSIGGDGFRLPTHVKEMEAESYAHQAFRHHGMTLPRRRSDWGRRYVGFWIAKDRAAGMPIDPRAESYANGNRSPYEPLRMTPPEWQSGGGTHGLRLWLNEASDLLIAVFRHIMLGTTAVFLILGALQIFDADMTLAPKQLNAFTSADRLAAYTGGVLWATVMVIWRTLTR